MRTRRHVRARDRWDFGDYPRQPVVRARLFLAEHLLAALAGSVVVSSAILAFGKVSGAFLNPAVTVSQAVSGWMPMRLLGPYLIVQLVAAVASGLFARIAFGAIGTSTEFGLPKLGDGTTVIEGVVLEGVGVFIRCSSSLYSAFHLEKRHKTHAAVVGVALFIPTLLILPYTGAVFNPAMSLAPAVASMDFGEQYLYLAGAVVGTIAAAIAFGLAEGKGHWK